MSLSKIGVWSVCEQTLSLSGSVKQIENLL